MDRWSYCSILANVLLVAVTADIGHIRTVDAQQDERVRLECTVTSKLDAEEAMWMRIRSPHNPDILTYRDNVVYAPDRIQLEQRRLSSSINANGTFIDTYFLTLTILRPNIDDEGRYICSRGKSIFAEYDLFIIVPPQFVDDNSFIQQRTLVEGSALHLSCSAHGRPKPSITWFSRTADGQHISLADGEACQETVCELRLANYTRHDATIIECVADNGKSTRISKVFHVDVYFRPNVLMTLRTSTNSRSVDLLLQCSSTANPPASIQWLDDSKQEIQNNGKHTIKTVNQSSSLSFSIVSQEHANLLYFCRSDNSIGHDEKVIDISDLIRLEPILIHGSTTVVVPTTFSVVTPNSSFLKKQKTLRPSRARSRPTVTTTIIMNATISSSNSFLHSTSTSPRLHLIALLAVIYFV